MATRCFGRAFFAGAAALPLLFSLRRAVDFAAALRAGDVFRAAFLLAARAAGFLDFFLAMMLSLRFSERRVAQAALCRGGKAKACPPLRKEVGTALSRLCPS